MATVDRARYKPDTYRSTLEAIVAELNPTVTPPTGTVYLPVQIVSFNDTDFPAANYRPGDNGIEQFVTVIYESVISVQLEGFEGMTAQQVQDDLIARLDAWAQTVKPAIPRLRRIIRAAKRLPPREIV